MEKKENSNEKDTNKYLCDEKWDKGQEISKEKSLIFISSKKPDKILSKFWPKAYVGQFAFEISWPLVRR